jgi:hypothetical protein
MKHPLRQPVTLDNGGDIVDEASVASPASGRAKPPRVRRFNRIEDWRKEIAMVYRAARRGEMPLSQATALTYILESGTRVARLEADQHRLQEQAEQVKQLTAQLAALQAGQPYPALPAPAPREPETLPAWAHEPPAAAIATGAPATS